MHYCTQPHVESHIASINVLMDAVKYKPFHQLLLLLWVLYSMNLHLFPLEMEMQHQKNVK
jgi:hypothetical protein